jgi:NB-ARC domain
MRSLSGGRRWWSSIRMLAASAEELARQLLVQLGTAWDRVADNAQDRFSALRAATAGKRLLILFDDVFVADQIKPLLGDVSKSAVIVTSRYRLKSLELHQRFTPVELCVFDDNAARELVTTIAGTDVAEEVLNKLLVVCGGLPLALEASAAQLAEGDLEEFLSQLSPGSALNVLAVDDDLVVKRVFDAVYRDLPADEQRAYQALASSAGVVAWHHFQR